MRPTSFNLKTKMQKMQPSKMLDAHRSEMHTTNM